MNKQKLLYNYLLLKYNKYITKLKRFQLTGRNIHRQEVLKRHINKLQSKLSDLYLTIQFRKMTGVAMLSASMMMITPEADAQITFAPGVNNAFSLTNVGYSSTPSFVDLDGDGDLDLMSGDYYGDFFYFENTGTASAASYAAAQTNPFGLSNLGYQSMPSFVDLDGDGDMDLISGDYYGDFTYFENTGTSTVPAFAPAVGNPFSITNIGNNTVPSFADIDNDGDLDLFSGESKGNFFYFENTGTSIAPVFAVADTNSFNLTGIGFSSAPSLVDVDGDGDFDLFSGDLYGDFLYFENTGTASLPSFAAVQTNPFSLANVNYYTRSSFADIDNDGDMDILTGEADGDFYFFENITQRDTTVSLISNAVTVNEGDASFDIDLDYSESSSNALHTVDLQLVSGDVLDVDNFSTMTATFNTATEKFTVVLTDDAIVEANETLSFALVNATNGLLIGTDSIFTLTIEDNDVAPDTLVTLSSNTATVNEGDASFDIDLDYSATSSNALHTVDLQLVSGDASDVDNFSTMTATFNSTTEKFTVVLTDDADVEANETLSFALVNASNGLVIGSDSIFTLTIEDNDADAIAEINVNDLKVYPNPSSDKVILELNSNEKQIATISLVDLVGKIIQSQSIVLAHGNNSIPIDLSKLASGNYFLNISTDKGNHTENLLIK